MNTSAVARSIIENVNKGNYYKRALGSSIHSWEIKYFVTVPYIGIFFYWFFILSLFIYLFKLSFISNKKSDKV